MVISGKNGSTLTGTMEQLNSFYTIDGAPYESREALKDGSFDFTKNTQFLDLYAELYDNGWFNEDISQQTRRLSSNIWEAEIMDLFRGVHRQIFRQ